MGGNINLTKIWMAAIISVFVVMTIFIGYSNFCSSHLPGQPPQCNMDPKYQSILNNISNEQYNSALGLGKDVGQQNAITSIFSIGANAVSGTINVFVMGLSAIEKFFGMIPLIGNIISLLGSVFPGFAGLIALLLVILSVYIGMRIIQSASNKFELP